MRLPRFTDATVGALWYLALVVALPTLSLTVAGLVWLWREGLLLMVLVGWLAVTGVAYVVFVNRPRKRIARALAGATSDGDPAQEDATLPHMLASGTDWSPRDQEIFMASCQRIEALIGDELDWHRLRELAVDVAGSVAQAYHGDNRSSRLRFTLPEILLLASTVSDRYRTLVMTHVPFADRIKVSTLMSVAEQRETIERGATWANNVRRGVRIVNPVGAVVGELRDQFTNRVFASVSRTLQRDLMRLLLQEIAQVSIDLYSGRLKVTDRELQGYRSRAIDADAARVPVPMEPLRVLLLGQVSAGKSSLVNALANELAAETDTLPSTDRTTVHVLTLEGLPPLHLIDTAGLDDDPDRLRANVDSAFEADVIVWVARATRPGRAPDATLREAIAVRFEARPERRPPPALLVLTHVDQLTPRAEWSPPYSLDDAMAGAESDEDPLRTKKRANLVAALVSARRQTGLDKDVPAIPVRIDRMDSYYNVDTVLATLMTLADAASATQLNRRRIDRADTAGSWRERLSQSRHLALGVGRALLRSATRADRVD